MHALIDSSEIIIGSDDDPFVRQFVNAEIDGPLPFHFPGDDYRQTLMDRRA